MHTLISCALGASPIPPSEAHTTRHLAVAEQCKPLFIDVHQVVGPSPQCLSAGQGIKQEQPSRPHTYTSTPVAAQHAGMVAGVKSEPMDWRRSAADVNMLPAGAAQHARMAAAVKLEPIDWRQSAADVSMLPAGAAPGVNRCNAGALPPSRGTAADLGLLPAGAAPRVGGCSAGFLPPNRVLMQV